MNCAATSLRKNEWWLVFLTHAFPLTLIGYGVVCIVGGHAWLLQSEDDPTWFVHVTHAAARYTGIGYLTFGGCVYTFFDWPRLRSAGWQWKTLRLFVGVLFMIAGFAFWLTALRLYKGAF